MTSDKKAKGSWKAMIQDQFRQLQHLLSLTCFTMHACLQLCQVILEKED